MPEEGGGGNVFPIRCSLVFHRKDSSLRSVHEQNPEGLKNLSPLLEKKELTLV